MRKLLGVASIVRGRVNFEFQEYNQCVVYLNDVYWGIYNLREMINEGIQPNHFLNDFLEIIYFIQQHKTLGNFDSDLSISESEKQVVSLISKDVEAIKYDSGQLYGVTRDGVFIYDDSSFINMLSLKSGNSFLTEQYCFVDGGTIILVAVIRHPV